METSEQSGSAQAIGPAELEGLVRARWNELVALRREFHQFPELSFQERRTAGRLAELMRDLGLEVRESIGQTGVSAVLRGAQPGRRLLIRADVDALPIQEASSLPYASRNPGVMHA